jgi:crotonobetainyl-CoA:carnitine CoA-transferase CaiB-like acyl-CoA transferase
MSISFRDARLVSIAQNVPGPLAVARLAALGARVVKFETPTGDPLAAMCPSWYDEMHAGVAVERIDLKSDEGRARLGALLRDADLLITSQRPSALGRLGLDAPSLRREAPELRLLRIVGSIDDPEAAGHDLTYQAHAGLLRDQLPVTLVADVMGSERAFAAALMLIGEPAGTTMDVGLADSLAPLQAPLRHGLTSPSGILGGALPYYGVYPAKSGRVAVAALEPHFERRLYERLDLSAKTDPGPRFLERTAVEWEAWGRAHDVPIVAVV